MRESVKHDVCGDNDGEEERKRKNERFERERSKVTVTRDWDDSRGCGKNTRSNSLMGKGGGGFCTREGRVWRRGEVKSHFGEVNPVSISVYLSPSLHPILFGNR